MSKISHNCLCLSLLEAHLILPSDSRPPLSTRENQHLVHSVHFITDISPHGDLHRYKLAEKTRVQHFSELSESAHVGGEFGEVDHFVLGWGGRHFGVFAL